MPRFYFDSHDGDGLVRDDVGVDLADEKQAEFEAAKGLAGLAADRVRRGHLNGLEVMVRDEGGEPVFRMNLAFEVLR